MDNNNVQGTIAKLKELVRKGNVSRILVRRGTQVIMNIPVTVGVVGAVVGITAAKWVVLAGVLATLGFGCTVEIVKDDGQIVTVVSEEDSQKVRDKASDIVGDVKEVIDAEIHKDSDDKNE